MNKFIYTRLAYAAKESFSDALQAHERPAASPMLPYRWFFVVSLPKPIHSLISLSLSAKDYLYCHSLPIRHSLGLVFFHSETLSPSLLALALTLSSAMANASPAFTPPKQVTAPPASCGGDPCLRAGDYAGVPPECMQHRIRPAADWQGGLATPHRRSCPSARRLRPERSIVGISFFASPSLSNPLFSFGKHLACPRETELFSSKLCHS